MKETNEDLVAGSQKLDDEKALKFTHDSQELSGMDLKQCLDQMITISSMKWQIFNSRALGKSGTRSSWMIDTWTGPSGRCLPPLQRRAD